MEAKNTLVELLCDFYLEVAKVKERIRNHSLERTVIEAMNLPTAPSGEIIASFVSRNLQTWIKNREFALASGRSGYETEIHTRVMYLMCALADELFILDLEWPGKDFWTDYLLEQSIYNQCSAGTTVFTQLDALLEGKRRGPLDDELAAVYLQVLQLGFQGRYRGISEKLQIYRNHIVRFTCIANAPGSKLYPNSYQSILSSSDENRLAPLSFWTRNILLGLIIYLTIGTSIWILLHE